MQLMHHALVKNHNISKIMDLFVFMNFSRDCSMTIEQFNSLFMDKLKLEKVLEDADVEVLLQRYRLDEFERAKTQRDEMVEDSKIPPEKI